MSYSFYVMCLTVSMVALMLLYGFDIILYALWHVVRSIVYVISFGPLGVSYGPTCKIDRTLSYGVTTKCVLPVFLWLYIA